MKTHKMMRIASATLIATLLTTSCISSTFAKYTVQSSYQQTARVAKWGVEVKTEGTLFDTTYLATEEKGTPANGMQDSIDGTVLSVESFENVVAPGTKNTDGLTFEIKGTPEVDVQVTVNASSSKGDIFLNGTDLPNLTTAANTSDTFNADNYMPVKFTLTHNGNTSKDDKDMTMTQLVERLNNLSKRYDAGTDLSTESGFGTYVITWNWDYDFDNKADTLLGSLKSGSTLIESKTLSEGKEYNLKTDLKIDISVTQID